MEVCVCVTLDADLTTENVGYVCIIHDCFDLRVVLLGDNNGVNVVAGHSAFEAKEAKYFV
jgi:hypothetical protein